MNKIRLGRYRHFKGDIMEVIGIAKHSETLEEFVVYKHVTGERAGEDGYWVRPIGMFTEEIERDDYKGPRFKYIGD